MLFVFMRLPWLPPCTRGTSLQKVRMAEDGWNSRDPKCVALAYTPDSLWRNHAEVEVFLTRKWAWTGHRLIKKLGL